MLTEKTEAHNGGKTGANFQFHSLCELACEFVSGVWVYQVSRQDLSAKWSGSSRKGQLRVKLCRCMTVSRRRGGGVSVCIQRERSIRRTRSFSLSLSNFPHHAEWERDLSSILRPLSPQKNISLVTENFLGGAPLLAETYGRVLSKLSILWLAENWFLSPTAEKKKVEKFPRADRENAGCV